MARLAAGAPNAYDGRAMTGFLRRLKHGWKRARLRLLNLYPPYLGAGVRVKRPEPDVFEVSMKLHWYNQNYVGTHFGGSLYSMCDPFYMLLLIEKLGRDYVVWDKAASIRFRRPGKGTVHARFHVPDERVEEIRRRADAGEVVEPTFAVAVTNPEGQTVAEVEKLLYVRRKRERRGEGEARE